MPRNVRNFFVNLEVDGRTPIATGPRNRDGALHASFLIRENGRISDDHVRIWGGKRTDDAGGETLILDFTFSKGASIYQHADGSFRVRIEKPR